MCKKNLQNDMQENDMQENLQNDVHEKFTK